MMLVSAGTPRMCLHRNVMRLQRGRGYAERRGWRDGIVARSARDERDRPEEARLEGCAPQSFRHRDRVPSNRAMGTRRPARLVGRSWVVAFAADQDRRLI